MEFAIYSRKSKQTGKGESIQNQIEYCQKYITNHFGTKHNIHIFSEEGYSAKNQCRPKFQEMLTLAKQKKLNYIVCYRLDRISRNVGDFAILIEQLSKWNTAFICVQEQFDTATPTGRAMMYMASVFAQLERETISERVKDNMFYLAKKGYWLGGTFPLGFTSQKVTENGHCYYHLIQQEQEIDIVKKIYAFFLECYNISEVKRTLEEYKIYTRQGNVFSVTALKEILSNPVYCKADNQARNYFLEKGADVTFLDSECSNKYGLMVYNKRNYSKKSFPRQNIENWIVALGKHEGILSGEKWVTIQNHFKNKTKHTKNDYALLSGILYCEICGEKMQSKKRRNQNAFDYICRGKLQGKCCSVQNLYGKETDNNTEKILLEYIEKENDFYKIFQKYQKKYQKDYQKELLYCKRQKQIYIDLLVNQNISDIVIEQINYKIEELTKQQQKLEYKLNKEYKSFTELWNDMSILQKQKAIQYLIKKGVWNGTELRYFL